MLSRERRSCLHKERIPGTGVVFGLVPGFLGSVIARWGSGRCQRSELPGASSVDLP